jgi:hypothetical protein
MKMQKGRALYKSRRNDMERFVLTLLGVCLCIGLPESLQALPPKANAHNEQSQPKDYDKKPTKYSDAPAKGEFQNQSSELASDQERRVVRESRYKNTYPEITDTGNSPNSTEPGEDSVVTINDYTAPLDPFPVAPSAAIVVGTVLSGKAFVSKDRTYVYSDYRVRVDRVLKQDASASLAVGEQIVVSRGGGTILFPSGHIRNYLINGEGFPAIGSQYLFFLGKPSFPQHEYEQIIGSLYQLSGGKVHPLDDEQMSLFDNMSDFVFLSKVEQAITKAQTGRKP